MSLVVGMVRPYPCFTDSPSTNFDQGGRQKKGKKHEYHQSWYSTFDDVFLTTGYYFICEVAEVSISLLQCSKLCYVFLKQYQVK